MSDDSNNDGQHRWEVDSSLGDEENEYDLESTQSLTSSVLAYTYENGRRYHAFRAGQYFMPNDDAAQEVCLPDMVHTLDLMILRGELYRAPVDNPQSILEIGTGTGIWAMDVADKFPGAHVIATDLSPIQPIWVLPNVDFQVDDCESQWSFDRQFDFIHIRNLSGGIADWPKLLKTCLDHLAPAGWLEVSNIETVGQSNNNALTEQSASFTWQTNLTTAASMVGRELNIAPKLETLMCQAGFANVIDDQYMVPMSAWNSEKKELSQYFQYLVLSELEALSLRLYTSVLGWSADELQTLLMGVRKEIRDEANQMFTNMHYVCGQKAGT